MERVFVIVVTGGRPRRRSSYPNVSRLSIPTVTRRTPAAAAAGIPRRRGCDAPGQDSLLKLAVEKAGTPAAGQHAILAAALSGAAR
jgi:hypothetical protein